MIFENLNLIIESTISKEIMLQMIVKTINDTVDLDDLIFILLIFKAYSRMHVMNFSTLSIIQRTMTIEKAMIEIKKFQIKRQIIDALNIRNDSIIISIHDLFLNLNVLIWRDNLNQDDKWIESFKLFNIENETCKIVLSSESIDFRSIVIKSFLIKSMNDVESIDENVQSFDQSFAIIKLVRVRRLSLKYQNLTNIIVFLQNDDSLLNQFEKILLFISSSISIFENSRRKEINDMLKKRVFELITIDAVFKNVRIFNFRFVNEIKHSDIADVYEKFKLMIQTYNDHDKTLMLTQSFFF
jgi:hypothetical protein